MARRFNKYDVVIANGQSLSAIQTLRETELPALLEIGSGWTTADITIKAGYSTPKNLFKDGIEFTISGVAADRAIILNTSDLLGIRTIQFRSGNSGTPVNQGADRGLTFTTIELD